MEHFPKFILFASLALLFPSDRSSVRAELQAYKQLKIANYDLFSRCRDHETIAYGTNFDFIGGFPAPDQEATAPETAKISANGRWLVDSNGRTVILRGINTSRPELDNLPLLKKWGINVVRLVFYWGDYEKESGVFDENYLSTYLDYIEQARLWGILVIFDMHQWFLSSRFSFRWGKGLPAFLFEDYQDNLDDFKAAFEHFWESKELHERLGDVWARIIPRLKDYPNLLAYDLFNEPNPLPYWYRGSTFFNREILVPFYNRLIGKIRSIDRETLIAFEPPTSDQYIDVSEIDPQFLEDPEQRLLYMPHHYTLHLEDGIPGVPLKILGHDFGKLEMEKQRHGYCGNPGDFEKDLNESLVMSERYEVPVLIGEWSILDGAKNAQRYIVDMLDTQAKLMVGSIFWSFGSKGRSLDLLDREGKPRATTMSAFLRPYPLRIGGHLEKFGYRVKERRFHLEYRSSEILASTTVYIPTQLLYPDGFEVRVTSLESDELPYLFDPRNNILSIDPPGSKTTITVVLSPSISFDEELKGDYYAHPLKRECMIASAGRGDWIFVPTLLLLVLAIATKRAEFNRGFWRSSSIYSRFHIRP